MALIFGVKCGLVFVRDYDLGIVKTIGGVYNPDRGQYELEIPGVVAIDGSDRVPIIFNNPEQVFQKKQYPAIHIELADMPPAMGRWMSVAQHDYRVPAAGAVPLTGFGPNHTIVSGWSSWETKVQAIPFDFSYQIQLVARYQHEANTMLRKVLRILKPFSKIDIVDSAGMERSYSSYIDGSVLRLEDFEDVADRMKGYVIGLIVEGELDLSDPEELSATTGFTSNFESLPDPTC